MPKVRCSNCGMERELAEGTVYAYCHCCGGKIQVEQTAPEQQTAAPTATPEQPAPSQETVTTPAAPQATAYAAAPTSKPAPAPAPVQYQVPMAVPTFVPRPAPVDPMQQYAQEQSKRAEKKQIFRRSTVLSSAFLISQVVGTLLAVLYYTAQELFPAAALFQADNGTIGENLFYVFWSTVSMTAVALVTFKLIKVKPYEVIDFSMPKALPLTAGVLACLGLAFIGNVTANVIAGFFEALGFSIELPESPLPQSAIGILLYFLASAAIPAINEELLCRGLLLGGLRKYGDGIAVVISAAVFGLFHGNFVQIPFAFILGLGLGYVTIACRSIWPAVIVHFLNNAMSCALSLWTEHLSEEQSIVISLLYYGLLIMLGIIGILLFVFNRKRFSKVTNEYSGLLTVNQRVGRVLASPTLIVFTVMMIGGAFATLTAI